MNVLKGNASGNAGKGTGRVLQTNSTNNVFIYYTDHGATNILGMPYGADNLHKKDLHETFEYMHEKKLYGKMIIYIEACYSGSMLEGLSPNMSSRF